jgi:sulfur-carrier protein
VTSSASVQVVLPAHLRVLAGVSGSSVSVSVSGLVTRDAVLDALEALHPVLRGTIRDRATGQRRAFVRFYACSADLSNTPADILLPDAVASGAEPFLIVGAMAGG